jgi:hypothetical protein
VTLDPHSFLVQLVRPKRNWDPRGGGGVKVGFIGKIGILGKPGVVR